MPNGAEIAPPATSTGCARISNGSTSLGRYMKRKTLAPSRAGVNEAGGSAPPVRAICRGPRRAGIVLRNDRHAIVQRRSRIGIRPVADEQAARGAAVRFANPDPRPHRRVMRGLGQLDGARARAARKNRACRAPAASGRQARPPRTRRARPRRPRFDRSRDIRCCCRQGRCRPMPGRAAGWRAYHGCGAIWPGRRLRSRGP